MRTELIHLLENSPYFGGLSEAHKQSLCGICAQRTARKGDVIFCEGGKGEGLFLLASGSVQLVKTSEDGKEVVIRTVEAGEIFAEVVLFEKSAYPVTANVLRNSVFYMVPRRDFLHLLDEKGLREDFMAGMMRRLRYLTGRILELTTASAEERLFGFLREQYGEKELYRLTISKKDVAAAIGVTPETLSRLILRLTGTGEAAWQGRTLRLCSGFWSRRGT